MFGRSSRWAAAFIVAGCAVVAAPSRAQDAAPDTNQKIEELQKQLDALKSQAEAIQKSIDALRGTAPAATTDASDDLLNVAPVTAAAPEATASAPAAPAADGTILDAQPVANADSGSSSKIFNPDISVIGNFIGHAGDTNPFDPRDTATLDEAEIAFEAFVDPYAKAKFFIAVGPDEVDVEEGFINFINLPSDLTAKVGKVKANFGKANTWHTHVRPWVDQPLVIRNFFGEEGLADSGVSVSRLFPNRFLYVEATGEVLSGHAEPFAPQVANDLFYNGHLRFFKDFSDTTNIDAGISYARGTSFFGDEPSGFAGANSFQGIDLTYRWRPLAEGTRKQFIARTEIIRNSRDDQGDSGAGFYTSADYKFAQRWGVGARIDRAPHADDLNLFDRGAAATLTFTPSEFSLLRGELRRVKYADDLTANELLLQLQFSIGAHGAHPF